ncbi:MAG: DUF928 domain-containing protein [Cyanobacteria bacterium J06632_22]
MPRFVFGCCLALLALLGVAEQATTEVFRPTVDGADLPLSTRRSVMSRCPMCNAGGLGGLYLLAPMQVATTTAAYPTLHWYQPTQGENRITVSLHQYDPEQETLSHLFHTSFVVTGEPGIAALPLSADLGMSPLVIGETYYWEVMFFCEPDSCRADHYAQGWVQRIEVDAATAQQLAAASPSERVEIAANAGLWLEAVTGLATLLRQRPEDPDLQRRWAELLASVGLEVLTEEPLLP